MKIPEYYKVNVNLSLCANQISLSYCEVYFIELKKKTVFENTVLMVRKGAFSICERGCRDLGESQTKMSSLYDL